MKLACILLVLASSHSFLWGQQDSLRALDVKIVYTRPDPTRWPWSRAGHLGDWGYCRYAHTRYDARLVMLYEQADKRSALISDSVRSDHKSFFVADSLVGFRATRKRVAFDVFRVVTGSSQQRPCHRSRLLEGFYKSNPGSSVPRRVQVIHFTCGSVRIQILCDSPDDLYETLKAEMESFVSSVHISN